MLTVFQCPVFAAQIDKPLSFNTFRNHSNYPLIDHMEKTSARMERKNQGRFLRTNWKVMCMINFRSSAERRLRSWCSLLKNFADSPELPHWNFESTRQLFERLDARDGVAVLDTGNVTTLQAGALLDITLRKIFLLPDGA